MWNIVIRAIVMVMLVFGFGAKDLQAASRKKIPPYKILKRAKILQKKGKTKKALIAVRRGIKSHPKFDGFYALAGAIYAELGEYNKAAKFYKRVSAENIPKRDRFYYGLSMFIVGSCQKALRSFAGVSRSDPNFDNGLYYSAVCQYRARRWTKARRLLQLAKKVSDPLRSPRRRLLIETRKRIRAEERNVSRSFQRTTVVTQPIVIVPYRPAPLRTPTQAAPKAKIVAVAPATTKSGKQVSGGPVAGFEINNTRQENHGSKEKSSTSFAYYVGANADLSYFAKPRKGGQPKAGVIVDVRHSTSNRDDVELVFTSPVNRPDELKINENRNDDQESATFKLELGPFVSFPVSKTLTLEAAFKYVNSRDGTNFDDVSTVNTLSAGADLNFGDATFGLDFSHIMVETPAGSVGSHQLLAVSFDKPLGKASLSLDYSMSLQPIDGTSVLATIDTIHNVSGGLEYSFKSFSLTGNGSYLQKVPVDPRVRIEGYEDQIGVDLGINIPLPINFSISATGSFLTSETFYKSDLVSSVDNSSGTASDPIATDAGSSITKFKVSVDFKPLPNTSASLSYSTSQTEWGVVNKAAVKIFQQEVPNIESAFGATVDFNYQF